MTRVLFIAGCWRSGSTLVGDVLGSLPGLCHVGELHHFWRRGLELNWLCGCGAPFRSCDFWRRVIADVEAAPDLPPAGEIDQTRRRMTDAADTAASPQLVAEHYPAYARAAARVAQAAHRASGAGFLVDSSKTSRYGHALLAGGGLEVFVLHLIRDPRATTYSLVERPKKRADDPQGSSMLQLTPEDAVTLWLSSNLGAAQLRSFAQGYAAMRYEDFVRGPWQCARKIAEALGLPVGEAASADAILPSHSLSGNPDRLRPTVRSNVNLDAEWRTRMDPRLREYVEANTRPLMQQYGYA